MIELRTMTQAGSKVDTRKIKWDDDESVVLDRIRAVFKEVTGTEPDSLFFSTLSGRYMGQTVTHLIVGEVLSHN